MVHALEEIRRLLKPDGYLIDIHPIREAPLIKVSRGEKLLFVEPDPGYDYDADIRHAEDALDEVVRRGSFFIERRGEFDLITHSLSVPELRDFFAIIGAYSDNLKEDEMLARQDEVFARVNQILQNAAGAEIEYHERARITRLNPKV